MRLQAVTGIVFFQPIRNQGLGRLMVQARLKLAQEKGCKTLGFQRICDMALFRYSNP